MIRSNRFISNFSLFATILIFIFNVSLGLAFYFMNKSNPVIWLIGTLFIGVSLTFLVSMSNLNKLLLRGIQTQNKKWTVNMNRSVEFTSSPDYWTKNVAYDSERNETTLMCYNKLPSSPDDNPILLGGELIKEGSGEDGDDVYVFSDDSMFPGKTLQEVRDMAEIPNKIDYIEGFTSPLLRRSDPDFDKHYHRHSDVQHILSGKIQTTETSRGNVDADHTHSYFFRPTGHSHYSDITGNADLNETVFNKYEETYFNLTNWISPYELPDGRYAIEINLNMLNKASNKCKLAKNFIWSNADYLCIKSYED